MTDQEKLQKLFQAALQDPSDVNKAPTRAFPTSSAFSAPVPTPAPVQVEQPAHATSASEPDVIATEEAPVVLPSNAALDDKTSNELGALLDEQRIRISRKRRCDTLVVLGVMFALGGSGFGWFVQDPQRVQAFKDAIRDVRSIADVKTMVEKYRESLDKVAVRGQQIEQATDAMGVVRTAADEEDPYFEDEMKGMMGGKGKTVGERNKAMNDNFGHMQEEHAVKDHAGESKVKLSDANSFSWDQ